MPDRPDAGGGLVIDGSVAHTDTTATASPQRLGRLFQAGGRSRSNASPAVTFRLTGMRSRVAMQRAATGRR